MFGWLRITKKTYATSRHLKQELGPQRTLYQVPRQRRGMLNSTRSKHITSSPHTTGRWTSHGTSKQQTNPGLPWQQCSRPTPTDSEKTQWHSNAAGRTANSEATATGSANGNNGKAGAYTTTPSASNEDPCTRMNPYVYKTKSDKKRENNQKRW